MSNDNGEKKLKGIAAGGVGAYALSSASPYATGQETLYHGTSKSNWDIIRKEGFKTSKGGTGTLSFLGDSEEFAQQYGDDFAKKNGPGYIYATKKKQVANAFGIQSGFKYEDFKRARENPLESLKFNVQSTMGPGNGKRIKMRVNYDDYLKNFEIDPDVGVAAKEQLSAIPGMNENFAQQLGKDTASRTKLDIGPENISGSATSVKSKINRVLKYVPEYYKKHTGRAVAGAAGAIAGAALLGYGANSLYHAYHDKTASDNELLKIAEDAFRSYKR